MTALATSLRCVRNKRYQCKICSGEFHSIRGYRGLRWGARGSAIAFHESRKGALAASLAGLASLASSPRSVREKQALSPAGISQIRQKLSTPGNITVITVLLAILHLAIYSSFVRLLHPFVEKGK